MSTPEARRHAIADFSQTLAQVRERAGTPSFREMAARSGAISHTTLHDAVRGHRLATWETVVEFAKACEADPEELRDAWESASQVVADPPRPEPSDLPDAEPGPARADAEPDPARADADPARADAEPGPARADAAPELRPGVDVQDRAATAGNGAAEGGHASRRIPIAVGALGLGAALATGAWTLLHDHGTDAPAQASSVSSGSSATSADAAPPALYSSSECPIAGPRGTSTPRTPGDDVAFVTDVTLPDCSAVAQGATVTKTWRLRNTGTVPWQGYVLRRLDDQSGRDVCQTIKDVPVAATRPGATVDISTSVTTPRTQGLCYGRFKLVDASGELAFAGGRPLTFQLVVR